jgi:hypothetical protein
MVIPREYVAWLARLLTTEGSKPGLVEETATKDMRALNRQELKGVRHNGDRKAKEARADGGAINYVDGDEDGNSDVESKLPTDEERIHEARPQAEVAANKRERDGRLRRARKQRKQAGGQNERRKGKGRGGTHRTPLTKVWVERREDETMTIEVNDGMTIATFRARLSHRWPSDQRDDQPRTRWVAT